jgi:hypothetical protein
MLRGISGQEDRIKGKGKGKEILMRYDGQVVQGEPEPQVRDPRRVSGFKKPVSLRPGRVDLYEVKYEVKILPISLRHHELTAFLARRQFDRSTTTYQCPDHQSLPTDPESTDSATF